jgi:hypothetical protein
VAEAEAPPAYAPPVEAPPAYAPLVEAPPAYAPLVEAPTADVPVAAVPVTAAVPVPAVTDTASLPVVMPEAALVAEPPRRGRAAKVLGALVVVMVLVTGALGVLFVTYTRDADAKLAAQSRRSPTWRARSRRARQRSRATTAN